MHWKTALCLVALSAAPSLAQGVGARCQVLDPTATPLNIRAEPNGRIIGQIDNLERVVIRVLTRDAKGRPWAYVSLEGSSEPLGWLFHHYLVCSRTP